MLNNLKSHASEELIERAKEQVIWEPSIMAMAELYARDMMAIDIKTVIEGSDMERVYADHYGTFMVHVLTQAAQQYYNLATK